jgi:hypothetical protein
MAKSSFPPWHLYLWLLNCQLITEVGNIFLKVVLANVVFMVIAVNVNEIVDKIKVTDKASAFEDILDFVKHSFGRNKHI